MYKASLSWLEKKSLRFVPFVVFKEIRFSMSIPAPNFVPITFPLTVASVAVAPL